MDETKEACLGSPGMMSVMVDDYVHQCAICISRSSHLTVLTVFPALLGMLGGIKRQTPAKHVLRSAVLSD